MRVFLTGASGLVGSRLASALTREGHELRAVSRVVSQQVAGLSQEVLVRLNGELLRIITASDDEILTRHVLINESLDLNLSTKISDYIMPIVKRDGCV